MAAMTDAQRVKVMQILQQQALNKAKQVSEQQALEKAAAGLNGPKPPPPAMMGPAPPP
jgi:hypothetical protein